jgi:hypothetical protein
MLRFTIRDVLWLTALVAFGVAWWIERQERIEQGVLLRTLTATHTEITWKLKQHGFVFDPSPTKNETMIRLAIPELLNRPDGYFTIDPSPEAATTAAEPDP